MKQYDAYIFDLYGTLVDIHTDESKQRFWREVAAFYSAHGAAYQGKELDEAYHRLAREEHLKLAQAETEADAAGNVEIDLEPVFARLYEQKGRLADSQLVARTAWVFRSASTSHLRAYAGAAELLSTLRRQGRQVYLLSNAQLLFTMPELKLLGLQNLFDDIFISSVHGVKKPSARFIRALLHKHRLQPEQCLMIGNDPFSDVAVARSVGMDSYYIHSAQSPSLAPSNSGAVYGQSRMDLTMLRKRLLRT